MKSCESDDVSPWPNWRVAHRMQQGVKLKYLGGKFFLEFFMLLLSEFLYKYKFQNFINFYKMFQIFYKNWNIFLEVQRKSTFF